MKFQAHTAYPNHIFHEDGDGLILSQYIPCQLDWQKNETKVRLTPSDDSCPKAHHRPRNRSYVLQITCDQPQEFTLKFCLPWWMSASPNTHAPLKGIEISSWDKLPFPHMPRSQVYLMIQKKKLPHIRLSQRRIVIRESDLKLWLESRKVQAC